VRRAVVAFSALLGACAAGPEVDLVGDGGAVVHAYTDVAFADTPEARAQGLVGHAPLGPDQAMMLDYPVVDQACITNASVDFPITAVFVDDAGGIVAVESLAAHDARIPCHDGVFRVLETDADGAALAGSAKSVVIQ
jgi:uncharacterized membrane protein (UPF0127 family)